MKLENNGYGEQANRSGVAGQPSTSTPALAREPSLAELEALRRRMQRHVIGTAIVVTLLLAGAFHLARRAPPDASPMPSPRAVVAAP